MTLFEKYRKAIAQAFIPIFVKDNFDTEVLLEGCRLAGVQVLEYTLRREDAHLVIPTLKQRFPHTVVFSGSTIDSEPIVNQMKGKFPQLMTVAELAPFVDGFVSMLPYSDDTLRKYHNTHVMIPSAETSGEALRQMNSGASFIKVCGPDFSFSKILHAAPVFGYCPTFITGGVRQERIGEAFAAGNILCAAGFDVILSGLDPKTLTPEETAKRLTLYIDTAKAERAKLLPQLAASETMTDAEFAAALPHYCSIL